MKRIDDILKFYDMTLLNREEVNREIADDEARFFHVLAKDHLGRKFFVKILAELDNEDTRRAIFREIIVNKYFFFWGKGGPNVRSFYSRSNNHDSQIYFMVRAFPRSEKIGFIQCEADIVKLTEEHARMCVKNLLTIHHDADVSLIVEYIKNELGIDNIYDVFDDVYDSFGGYRENTLVILSMFQPELSSDMDEDEKMELIARSLENHGDPYDIEKLLEGVTPKYSKLLNQKHSGEFGLVPFWMIMERRLGARDFRKSVKKLFARYQKTVESFQQDRYFLVHGDCCPNNTFFYDSGDVEFVDWGHAGITKNELLALIHDFGNMRARAWNNKAFREALDNAILDYYKSIGKEEAGKAVVALGILRSHCLLAGFFEKYPIEKQRLEQERARKEGTEMDVRKAFQLSGIEL